MNAKWRTADKVQHIEPGEVDEPFMPAHTDGQVEGGVDGIKQGDEHAPAQRCIAEGVQGPVDVAGGGMFPESHTALR